MRAYGSLGRFRISTGNEVVGVEAVSQCRAWGKAGVCMVMLHFPRRRPDKVALSAADLEDDDRTSCILYTWTAS